MFSQLFLRLQIIRNREHSLSWRVQSTVSSASARTSQRTKSQSACSVNCFFGFSSYLTENTFSVGIFSQLFLRLQLVPHREHSSVGMCSQLFLRLQLVPHREQSPLACLVNCFFGFSSYLTENTISVGMFRQLFLRLQLVLHREHSLSCHV